MATEERVAARPWLETGTVVAIPRLQYGRWRRVGATCLALPKRFHSIAEPSWRMEGTVQAPAFEAIQRPALFGSRIDCATCVRRNYLANRASSLSNKKLAKRLSAGRCLLLDT